MARLFVAVRPPAEVRSLLEELSRADDPAVRRVPVDQWHVTLQFWPDSPAEPVIAALDAALAVRPSMLPPATAHLGPSVERLGPSAIVVPVSGLDGLAEAVRSAIDAGPADPDPPGPDDDQCAATSRRERSPFRGHLTLGRFRGRPRRNASTAVLGAPVDAVFDVREIELVESELGRTGATHRTLGTWSLPS